jgi:hypothetical protein
VRTSTVLCRRFCLLKALASSPNGSPLLARWPPLSDLAPLGVRIEASANMTEQLSEGMKIWRGATDASSKKFDSDID